MHEHNEIELTTYDRLLRAWENSMELTRDFEMYAKRIGDDEEAVQVFQAFAEEEGQHAAKFRSMLLDYKQGNKHPS